MSTTNKQGGGGSAWSRPLNNNRGRFGGGGGSNRAPPGMEGSRDSNNNNSRNNSWRDRGSRSSSNNSQSQTPNNGSRSKQMSAATPSTPAPPESKEQNERNVLRERFLHLCISMIGQTVTLTQTNGLVLEGIFHTFAPFENQPKDIKNIYVIQACKMIKPPADGENNAAFEDGATVLVPAAKVASVHVKSMRLDAANAAEKGVSSTPDDMFQTDSQISGGKGGSDRLVAAGSEWTSSGAGGDASLEGQGSGSGASSMNWRAKKSPASGGSATGVSGNMNESIGNWDQFTANKEKFGVKTTFDENLYTTKLDRDNIDASKFQEAARIAREIESQTTTNIHLAEERNQKLALDFDEEDLYSGVLDKSGKDKAAREEEARKKAAAPKMNYAAAAATKKEGAAATPSSVEEPKTESATPPDISTLKVSSEEKKVDPENEQTSQEDKPKETDDKKSEEDKGEEKEEEKPKSKLNVNAKAFTFNPGAKSFTPSAPSAPAATTPAQMQGHPMMGGQFVPGGPPMPGKAFVFLLFYDPFSILWYYFADIIIFLCVIRNDASTDDASAISRSAIWGNATSPRGSIVGGGIRRWSAATTATATTSIHASTRIWWCPTWWLSRILSSSRRWCASHDAPPSKTWTRFPSSNGSTNDARTSSVPTDVCSWNAPWRDAISWRRISWTG